MKLLILKIILFSIPFIEIKADKPLVHAKEVLVESHSLSVEEKYGDRIELLGVKFKDPLVLCQILIAIVFIITFIQSGLNKVIDRNGNLIGNGNYGIAIEGGANNTLGGTTASDGNTIVAGNGVGIKLVQDWQGTASNSNIIINNKIGNFDNTTPGRDNNGEGIIIHQQSSNNTVGLPNQGNIISNNQNSFSAIPICPFKGTQGARTPCQLVS